MKQQCAGREIGAGPARAPSWPRMHGQRAANTHGARFILSPSVRVVACIQQRMGKIALRNTILRRQRQGSSEIHERAVHIVAPLRKGAKIEVGIRIIRQQFGDPSRQHCGGVEVAQERLDVAELEQNIGIVGHRFPHTLQFARCLFRPAVVP